MQTSSNGVFDMVAAEADELWRRIVARTLLAPSRVVASVCFFRHGWTSPRHAMEPVGGGAEGSLHMLCACVRVFAGKWSSAVHPVHEVLEGRRGAWRM